VIDCIKILNNADKMFFKIIPIRHKQEISYFHIKFWKDVFHIFRSIFHSFLLHSQIISIHATTHAIPNFAVLPHSIQWLGHLSRTSRYCTCRLRMEIIDLGCILKWQKGREEKDPHPNEIPPKHTIEDKIKLDEYLNVGSNWIFQISKKKSYVHVVWIQRTLTNSKIAGTQINEE